MAERTYRITGEPETEVHIEHDEYADAPWEENLYEGLTFLTAHPEYKIGDRPFTNRQEMEDVADKLEGYEKYTVWLFDHSGLTLSLSDFKDPWDSGKLGVLFVDKKEHPKPEETAREYIEACNQYLSGDVWRVVEYEVCPCCDRPNDQERESTSGFFGIEAAEQHVRENYPGATEV
jgi:hypothetical protein